MSNIGNAFMNGKALAVYIPCGDPELATSAAAVLAAQENGADLIVLGIPFSDPTAEGPVIQAASLRALGGGVTTDKILAFAKELRGQVTLPMVFMTYANVVFSYGAERFMKACSEAQIGGLILPDLPFDERDEFMPVCREYGVELISVIAYNSAGRIPMIAKESKGFVCLSAKPGEGKEAYEEIRMHTDTPCIVQGALVGDQDAGQVRDMADGVMTDEAIAQILGEYGTDAPEKIGLYVKRIKQALNG